MSLESYPEEPQSQELPSTGNIPMNLDKLQNSESLQGKLENAIDKLRNHPQWQSKAVDGFWNKLSEEDKTTLYDRGEQGISTKISPLINKIRDIFGYDAKKLKMFGSQVAPATRSLVQLNLFPAPASKPQAVIAADIQSDHKKFKRMLKVAKVVLMVLAPECMGEFNKIEGIVKQIDAVKTDAATRQQNTSGQQEQLPN